jgi:nucleotide-binding universal stress UspA family protein
MSVESRPRRILCAIAATSGEDGGLSICRPDQHAAQQATELAARAGAVVRFVHAVDWVDERKLRSEADSVETDKMVEIVEQELQPGLAELRQIAAALGVEVEHEVRRGKPAQELLAAASDWDADVVAMSPRRDLPLSGRVLHGSTAGRMLKDSPCPVWVVQPRSNEVRRVLALIDRSEASRGVASATKMLAEIYGAELFALCCLEYPGDIALHRLPAAQSEIQRYHLDERQQARDDLERFTGDGKWSLILGEDWVVREAPRLIEAKEIDLVVLAGTSKPRLAGALLGTTAQKLLEHVGVSVWVTRLE